MQFLALPTCSEKLLHFFVLFEHVQGSRLPKCTSREINLRSLESCTDRAWTVTIGGDQRGLDFLAGRITTRFLLFIAVSLGLLIVTSILRGMVGSK